MYILLECIAVGNRSKTKLTSVEGQHKGGGYFLFFVKVLCPLLFSLVSSAVLMMPKEVHSGKIYRPPSFLLR